MSKEIIAYYEKTAWDYRQIWDPSPVSALHFGMYDEQADHHRAALINTNRVMATCAGLQTGKRVLDAGCGQGSTAFWLAQTYHAQVLGINLVPAQLSKASQYATSLGLSDQVQFKPADYCQTGLEAGQFDLVWACESLCHASDKKAFYQEAFRLLKPGGRLVIAEYLRTDRPLASEQEALLSKWLNAWAIPDLDSLPEHRQHAREAGFETFQSWDMSEKVRVSLRNLNEHVQRWYRLGRWLNRLGLVSKERLLNAYGSGKLYEAFLQGIWSYQVLVGKK
jgi:tocopherol O-methyltransferase